MTELGVEYGCKYTLTGPDGTKVVFNDSTDENFVGILSPESSGLDAAEVREDAADATEEDGGHHGSFFEGRRPVVLQGTIIATSAKQRNERVAKLKRASRALRGDAILEWEPSGGAKVELKLRRQQPLRITKGYVKDFQLPMVAADIFPKGVVTHSVGENSGLLFELAEKEINNLAVTSTYIYWSNTSKEYIGRYKISSGEKNEEFIGKIESLQGITIDATYIYWAGFFNRIGRAKLDGTSVEKEFIKLATSGQRVVAVDSTYIYWQVENGPTNKIGRAKLNGTEVNESFIALTKESEGHNMVVDASYIYWSNLAGIGRAKLNGTEVNEEFIGVSGGVVALALNENTLYYANGTGGGGKRGIYSIPSAGGTARQLNSEPSIMRGIFIYNKYIYWTEYTKYVRQMPIPTTLFTNAGDAEAAPIIKVYGPGQKFMLENKTRGGTVVLEVSEANALKQNEYFEVNFSDHTIKKNGTSYAYNTLVFASSTWWKFAPGVNEIIVTGGPAICTWQDTYL